MTNLNEGNFEKEVLSHKGYALVDFWASWCAPCRMLSPVIQEIEKENSNIKVCKVNVDENLSLSVKYGINSIPAVLLFKDGIEKSRSIGFVPKENLEGMWKN